MNFTTEFSYFYVAAFHHFPPNFSNVLTMFLTIQKSELSTKRSASNLSKFSLEGCRESEESEVDANTIRARVCVPVACVEKLLSGGEGSAAGFEFSTWNGRVYRWPSAL